MRPFWAWVIRRYLLRHNPYIGVHLVSVVELVRQTRNDLQNEFAEATAAQRPVHCQPPGSLVIRLGRQYATVRLSKINWEGYFELRFDAKDSDPLLELLAATLQKIDEFKTTGLQIKEGVLTCIICGVDYGYIHNYHAQRQSR